jgi:hypothetical protein
MPLLDRIGVGIGRKYSADTHPPSVDDEKKEPDTNVADEERHGSIAFDDPSKGTDVPVEEAAQRGVQKVEAATTAWSKWTLAAVLFKYVNPRNDQCDAQLSNSHLIASGSSS